MQTVHVLLAALLVGAGGVAAGFAYVDAQMPDHGAVTLELEEDPGFVEGSPSIRVDEAALARFQAPVAAGFREAAANGTARVPLAEPEWRQTAAVLDALAQEQGVPGGPLLHGGRAFRSSTMGL